MKTLFRVLLILVVATQAFAETMTTNVDTKGVRQFPTTVDWTGCSSLVAYWLMDEASGTREQSAGTCGSNCDLTENGTPSSIAGLRGNAFNADGKAANYLSCADATCTDLDFTSDFTFAGFNIPGGVFGSWWFVNKFSSNDGYRHRPDTFFTAIDVYFQVDAATSQTSGIVWANFWNFSAFTFDDTANESRAIQSNPRYGWNYSSPKTTSGLTATSVDFKISVFSTGGNEGSVDDMSAWNVPLSESELCYICSCFVDGSNCTHDGTDFVTKGHNAALCGGCTLPAYNASCPS